ncbi:putative CBS domain and cyclic nucleotide-regulated nucleotidyltransferase [Desulfarculus baarsii DSM 2075]|uniref:CBS domain and cyclic nucleotide-regulated nucleotidyltransferase n=1 Tax=Desulfarculus baarsii (strain ATCC 33931 / DSM 2075 / LMG 7858 / VKM B-1802 / 2st14) TaxID=644282 RepID=E1QF37_DESB2|nr:putative nucleotidyltransferase substrate binding domain-containing protein [Desulfarculus baarsii]ADK84173.1 putative CBS domain and cyclic nucleotide-regulated nucleotidyltransferase [Desulfarculus baarsii DSM 2075]
MDDFPWRRVLDFVRGVAPFDALGPDELGRVARSMEIAYFPRGRRIIAAGGAPAQALHIIQSGAAEQSLPARDGRPPALIDLRGEGDVFGAASLLAGQSPLFDVVAREDMVCYLLPAEPFKALVADHAAFQRFFGSSLAHDLAAAASLGRATPVDGLDLGLGAALSRSRVGEVMSRQALCGPPQTSLRQAARLMTERQVGSIIVADAAGQPIGILTDSDFRGRVMLSARHFDQPIADFMTSPVRTIAPNAYAFDALLTMSRHGLHHLAVVEGGRLVGVVSDRDLQALTGASPVALAREIDKAESVDELVGLHGRVDRVIERLLRLGGSARDMLELVTEFNDRLTHKLVQLCEADMEAQGLGPAPTPYCWLALGSEGRREQTLRTDQDNAIVFANVPADSLGAVKGWFLGLAHRVTRALEACGFPLCNGDVMADNPRWCQTLDQWKDVFGGWVSQPKPLTLRMASIFFDFRAIYAESDYDEALREHLRQALEGNRLFLRFMAKNGLYNRAPLGFLRQLVVERGGEHKNKLNLKNSGLMPLVDGARVLALDQGVMATGTLDRLAAAAEAGVLRPALAADLAEAFGFITLMRIGRHLEARAAGQTPDNYIDPASLGSLQRKTLKESFRVISEFQALLEHRYQTWLLT